MVFSAFYILVCRWTVYRARVTMGVCVCLWPYVKYSTDTVKLATLLSIGEISPYHMIQTFLARWNICSFSQMWITLFSFYKCLKLSVCILVLSAAMCSWNLILTFQTGLSGSSAIVCAALNCMLDFYKVRHLVKVEERPNLILEAEKELGIVAGLQDRVVQVYGGLVFMVWGLCMWQSSHANYTFAFSSFDSFFTRISTKVTWINWDMVSIHKWILVYFLLYTSSMLKIQATLERW